MSSVTGSLSTIQRSSACRTSTGAGQQPQLRPQRDSGMTHKYMVQVQVICTPFPIGIKSAEYPFLKIENEILQNLSSENGLMMNRHK